MKNTNINKLTKSILSMLKITILILLVLIISSVIFLDLGKTKTHSFDLNKDNIVETSEDIIFPSDGKVKLYHRNEGIVEEINLEDYIVGVVASEMPANFSEEALKAQAVAARTFYINKRNNPCKDAKEKDAEICDTTHCQVYMSKEEKMKSWQKNQAENNWNKVEQAVKETSGQVLTYENKVLEYPQFFAVSSGKTEDAKEVFSTSVPYLKSEESKGEEIAPKYKTAISIPINDFINKINNKYTTAKISKNNINSIIKIDSYTEAGGVKEITIGNQKVKGTEFRELFALNSTNFTLNFTESEVKINCIGYGHGVGMSQWGANIMAQNGSKYDEILKHYYNGVEIKELKYK